jgi:hypothetical protein
MDIKDLVPITLLFLFVGMLLGVGVLVVDQFGRAARTSVTAISGGQAMNTSGSVDLADTFCTSIVSVDNATTSFDVGTYNVKFTDADGCVISHDAISGCKTPGCNITYKYGATTSTATAMINTNSAITPIASTWMALLVTVVVLSIILGLVITSFAGRR